MPLYVSFIRVRVLYSAGTCHAFMQIVSISAYFLLSHHVVYICLPLPDYEFAFRFLR